MFVAGPSSARSHSPLYSSDQSSTASPGEDGAGGEPATELHGWPGARSKLETSPGLQERTTSVSSLADLRHHRPHRAPGREKAGPRPRKFSLGALRSRSASLDSERLAGGSMQLPTSSSAERKKKDEEKTFSVTFLGVSEHEKNKIVDLLHKAKSLISKKVEKVMGKKPKANSISNVDALQTVLESWMVREEEEDKEDSRMVERLSKEQEEQVETLLSSGQDVPIIYKPDPIPAVEDNAMSVPCQIEEEPEEAADLEVCATLSRLTIPRPRTGQDGSWSPGATSSVPCPFGNRPDCELYPPKLRRPSSHYGAGAAAACSRPGSRALSASPVQLTEQEHDVAMPDTIQEDCGSGVDGEEEEEVTPYTRPGYTRPDSFVIPIGGVWRPGDESGDPEVRWGKVTTEEEYQEELRRESEGVASGRMTQRVAPPRVNLDIPNSQTTTNS